MTADTPRKEEGKSRPQFPPGGAAQATAGVSGNVSLLHLAPAITMIDENGQSRFVRRAG
jgi:hypothetical protein